MSSVELLNPWSYCAGLTNLECLNFDACKVGDEGIKHLKGICYKNQHQSLKEWQIVALAKVVSSPYCVQILTGLTNLHILELSDSEVKNSGLPFLTGMVTTL